MLWSTSICCGVYILWGTICCGQPTYIVGIYCGQQLLIVYVVGYDMLWMTLFGCSPQHIPPAPHNIYIVVYAVGICCGVQRLLPMLLKQKLLEMIG